MLSENLKKHLDSRGMSVYKLSKLSNVPQSTIRDIIIGKTLSTGHDKLTRLANALNISYEELLGEKESTLEGAYIEIAKIAQDKKIDPEKLKALIDLISKE